MSLNTEIQRICRRLGANKNVVEKADYFLRKLNRKTAGSLGSLDMLKYLICIDLSYRHLGLKWDVNIANKLGLKSKEYNNAFNKIQNKLNISKNKTVSFQQLTKYFKCNHITIKSFDKIYKRYQSQKINSLPIIQQKYINLATSAHKAAIFYLVATKIGKVKVNEKELCDLMRCQIKIFQTLCADIRNICFNSNNNSKNNNINPRKRKRFEMETEYENDEMFCDQYEKREHRKYKEWKERVIKENGKMKKQRNANNLNNGNKRRKIMNISNNKSKSTKMFDIFEKAKKKNKSNITQLNDNHDIDLKQMENTETENDNNNNDNNNNNNNNNNNSNVDIDGDKQLSAREAARRAALQRQQLMTVKHVQND